MLLHGKIVMENGAEIPFELYPDDAPITCLLYTSVQVF